MALLVGGVVAVSGCAGGNEPQLAIMEGAHAELPSWVSEPAGLPVDDLAHVADRDHLSVFASRDGDGLWCVILAIEPTSDGSDWAAGANCAPSDRFATEGVWVEAASSERGGGALLLPDDFGGEIGDDWKRVNDNLAIHR